MTCLVSVALSLSLCLRACLFINAHSWNEVKRQFSLKCCHCFCCTHCEWAIIKATVGGLKQTTIQSKRATTTTATRATSREQQQHRQPQPPQSWKYQWQLWLIAVCPQQLCLTFHPLLLRLHRWKVNLHAVHALSSKTSKESYKQKSPRKEKNQKNW